MVKKDSNKQDNINNCCHYTNIKGLLGILESECIFATHFSCLNDSKEFIWARELLFPVIREIIKENTSPTIDSLLIDQETKRFLEILYKPLYSELPLFLFCSSLHDKKDNDGLLTLWRAYGKHNDCIGIVFDAVKDEAGKQIHYSSNFINNDYIRIKDSFKDPISKWIQGQESAALNDAIKIFLDMVTGYKHPGFIDEKEFRLVFWKNDLPIKIRNKNNRIIYYVEKPFPHNEIKSIIIGPCDRQEKIRKNILLHPVVRSRNIKIHLSSIPFIWD